MANRYFTLRYDRIGYGTLRYIEIYPWDTIPDIFLILVYVTIDIRYVVLQLPLLVL